MKIRRSEWIVLGVLLVAAMGWKAWLVWRDVIPFNSDEAIVALMARHILQGERPIFFYGQAYMGSLDAYLVAAGFSVFGQNVWVIRLVQALLYAGTIITGMFVGKAIFQSTRAGLLAAAVLALPTVNMTLYTTASLGGYGEALFIGNLILLASIFCLEVMRKEPPGAYQKMVTGLLLFGLLTGLGLWANGLTLVYSAPAGLALGWVIIRKAGRLGWLKTVSLVLAAGAGFFAGSLPWWIFAASSGWASLIKELFGSAVAVETQSWIVRSLNHLVNLGLLGGTALFGLRPPWGVSWLAQPLLPAALLLWLGVLYFLIREILKGAWKRPEFLLLPGTCLVLSAGFIFTAFGVDPSGRYFLPVYIVLAIALGGMLIKVTEKLGFQAAAAGVVVVFQLWGSMQCALLNPPGLTTQFDTSTIIDHRYDSELISFLNDQGETRGYTTYWVAYPLAFLSQEKLIYVPRLPYHRDLRYTPRDDRYEPYTIKVQQSQQVAYISAQNPALDQLLREQLSRIGVKWKEQRIGDYSIFYQLSRVVQPQEIGLGELTTGALGIGATSP